MLSFSTPCTLRGGGRSQVAFLATLHATFWPLAVHVGAYSKFRHAPAVHPTI